MMKLFIMRILKNLGGMILTKKVIVWALTLAASKTTNKIDDNIIKLVEAAYDNDPEGVMKSTQIIVEELS